MRRWIGVFLAAGVTAGAFALPVGANHEQITLQALDSQLVLPDPHQGESVAMRFTWSPADTLSEGSNIHICWNGRFDRSRLLENPFPVSACSSGSAGLLAANVDDYSHAHYDTLDAGRYEVFIQRETPCEGLCYPPPPRHFNASNVVAVEAVDPCRLRLVSLNARGVQFPLQVGSPMKCETFVKSGKLEAAGEDGSRIELIGTPQSGFGTGVDYETSNYFTQERFARPIFRMKTGGKRSTLTFTTGSRLGGLVTSASNGVVHIIAVAPARAELTYRNGVGHVHVRSGRVVALGVGQYEAAWEIPRYCGRRQPTIACLSKMRYRYYAMKRGKSIKARVLRAGQSATFRRVVGRGLISFVH